MAKKMNDAVNSDASTTGKNVRANEKKKTTPRSKTIAQKQEDTSSISAKPAARNSSKAIKKKVLEDAKNLARPHKVLSLKHEKIVVKNLHTAVFDSAAITPSEERLKKKIVGLVKECNDHYNLLNDNDEIPNELHDIERNLQEVLLETNEKVGSFTNFLNQIYQERSLNLEEKARLREVVVRLFSCVYFSPKFKEGVAPHDGKIIDVYGLPAFASQGSIDIASQHAKIIETLENVSRTCGYFTAQSSVHVLLDCPLEIKAFSDPAVLSALATMYGEILIQPHMDPVVKQEIMRSFDSILSPYRIKSATATGFIVPCIRVWSGSYEEYKETQEISAHWNNTKISKRLASQSLWQSFVGAEIRKSNIPKGGLLIRPPAPPLVAQAQSLAWELTQQVYQRLGDTAFSEINFISVSDNTLSLRAYDHRNKIVAQSDIVHLFDVITAADDFSLLLKEECDTDGPHSMLREKSRK